MSDQRDKAFVRESIDQGLSSLEGNPFLAQRVLAQANGKEETVVKKKISVSFVLVAMLLFLMAGAALAAGLGFLGVNWFGNTDENGGYFAVASSTPMPAATDERKVSIEEKFDAVCQEVFTKAHNREYIFVSYENEQGSVVSCCPSTQDVWNLEDFKALISMNPELPVPQHLPEGYGFQYATVNFDCKADGELVLTSKETLEDGITITRYHADDTDMFISGYMIWLADERVDRMDGDYLKSIVTIEMTMQDWSDPAEMTLGFPTSLSVHPVHVNQMDQALEVEYPDSCTVEMRHEMTNPVTYKGNRWIDCHEIDSYGECHIRISSELLSADEMIRMFDE